ncbi:glycoprotein X [Nocardioidaceae bacterium Broad-1]|nr:glycoprotein X [Nocardioidaceae bacterium Broad-1]
MTPQPVDAEVAAALAAAHLDDFFVHSPYIGDDWIRHSSGDPLKHVIGIPVRQDGGVIATYFVELGFSHYDTWPPLVTFVEKDENGQWVRARIGSAAYPFIFNSPGAPTDQNRPTPFQFALHDTYSFPDGRVTQLVCFSYSLDYYISPHAPSPDQKWTPGRDRLDATLNRLYKVLNSTAYAGPSRTAA